MLVRVIPTIFLCSLLLALVQTIELCKLIEVGTDKDVNDAVKLGAL